MKKKNNALIASKTILQASSAKSVRSYEDFTKEEIETLKMVESDRFLHGVVKDAFLKGNKIRINIRTKLKADEQLIMLKLFELLHVCSTNNQDRDKEDFYTGNTGKIIKADGWDHPMPVFTASEDLVLKGMRVTKGQKWRKIKQIEETLREISSMATICNLDEYFLLPEGTERIVSKDMFAIHLVNKAYYRGKTKDFYFELSFLFLFELLRNYLKLPVDGVERLHKTWRKKVISASSKRWNGKWRERRMDDALVIFYRTILSQLANQQTTYKRVRNPLFDELGIHDAVRKAEAKVYRTKKKGGKEHQQAKDHLGKAKKRCIQRFLELVDAMVKNRIIIPQSIKQEVNSRGQKIICFAMNPDWFDKPINMNLTRNSKKK